MENKADTTDKSQKAQCCTFCKKESSENNKEIFLLLNPTTALCENCIKTMNQIIIDQYKNDTINEEGLKELLFPQDIFKQLSDIVISQDDAKRKIAIAIAQHQRRLQDPSIKKANILLAGPTGTGKTELARAVAQIMQLPFIIADATNLTARGYAGADVESIIERLLVECKFDVSKAEKGIIFLDEIDKIARCHNPDSGANTTSVQQELLKILEGSVLTIKRKSSLGYEEYRVNTANILFICSGAFDGINVEEKNVTPIGIGVTENTNLKKVFKLNTDSLTKYGFIPEFIGRLSVIAETKELTKQDLLKILVEPKNSIISQYKKLFNIDNINIDFSQKFLESIVDESLKEKTGARGLKSILEKKLENIYFQIHNYKNKSITLQSDEEIKNNENINNHEEKIAS